MIGLTGSKLVAHDPCVEALEARSSECPKLECHAIEPFRRSLKLSWCLATGALHVDLVRECQRVTLLVTHLSSTLRESQALEVLPFVANLDESKSLLNPIK